MLQAEGPEKDSIKTLHQDMESLAERVAKFEQLPAIGHANAWSALSSRGKSQEPICKQARFEEVRSSSCPSLGRGVAESAKPSHIIEHFLTANNFDAATSADDVKNFFIGHARKVPLASTSFTIRPLGKYDGRWQLRFADPTCAQALLDYWLEQRPSFEGEGGEKKIYLAFAVTKERAHDEWVFIGLPLRALQWTGRRLPCLISSIADFFVRWWVAVWCEDPPGMRPTTRMPLRTSFTRSRWSERTLECIFSNEQHAEPVSVLAPDPLGHERVAKHRLLQCLPRVLVWNARGLFSCASQVRARKLRRLRKALGSCDIACVQESHGCVGDLLHLDGDFRLLVHAEPVRDGCLTLVRGSWVRGLPCYHDVVVAGRCSRLEVEHPKGKPCIFNVHLEDEDHTVLGRLALLDQIKVTVDRSDGLITLLAGVFKFEMGGDNTLQIAGHRGLASAFEQTFPRWTSIEAPFPSYLGRSATSPRYLDRFVVSVLLGVANELRLSAQLLEVSQIACASLASDHFPVLLCNKRVKCLVFPSIPASFASSSDWARLVSDEFWELNGPELHDLDRAIELLRVAAHRGGQTRFGLITAKPYTFQLEWQVASQRKSKENKNPEVGYVSYGTWPRILSVG